jgi:hypothetical protein
MFFSLLEKDMAWNWTGTGSRGDWKSLVLIWRLGGVISLLSTPDLHDAQCNKNFCE